MRLFFKKEQKPKLTQLPKGSFTLDARGRLLTSTLPQWFPASHVHEVAKRVLTAFERAREARMPLKEIIIHYETLKITARELKGGAIVFLYPTTTELGRAAGSTATPD